MQNSITAYVGWLLLLSAFGFYAFGIGYAIHISWSTVPITQAVYPEALSTAISSIQALMLTNLGVVLGISITNPTSSLAKTIMLHNSKAAPSGVSESIPNPLAFREKIQLTAMVIYILSLIACLVTWGHDGFSSAGTDVLDTISQSGKMFIGVVLAYLTAVLGVQN